MKNFDFYHYQIKKSIIKNYEKKKREEKESYWLFPLLIVLVAGTIYLMFAIGRF